MKRRDSVFLIALIVATTAAALYLYRDNRDLRRQLADLRGMSPASGLPNPGAAAPAPVAATGPVEARPAEDGPAMPGEPAPGARAGRRDRMGETMTRVMSDPDARQAMLGRMKSQIDRMYGPLFSRLGLDEVQAETLRTLLAETEMARNEYRLLERLAATDEEREQLRTQREAKLQALGAEVNGVLGAEGTQVLADYQRTYPERQVAEEVSRRASYAGAPLSMDASDQLARVLSAVREEMPVQNPAARGGRQPGQGTGEPLTQDAANEFLAAKLTQDREILARSQSFLSTPQLEALADRQIDELEQIRAQLNFQLNNPDMVGPMGMGGMGGGPGGFGGGRGGGTRGGRPGGE